MGGDTILISTSSIDDEQLSPVSQRLEKEAEFGELGFSGQRNYYEPLEIEANERRMRNVYEQVIRSYDELKLRIDKLEEAQNKILSYTPGSLAENVGGMTKSDYDLPETTTLLLVGPKGSGKSSLINRISRVFEDDKFAPERAQVSYNSSVGEGTLFLQEYMIPRNWTSFCLYDSRSLSDDSSENLKMIEYWMTKGVRHGELVKRSSDGSSLKAIMKCKARQVKPIHERKMVNFVIFVVNGLSVLKCMNSDGTDMQYTNMVAEIFCSPFLSFRDHKPAIAITHGDLLSLSDRARVRVYLGELLGVHPNKQTFDIPDNSEPTTDLTIVDMIRCSLEHADRNLPGKSRSITTKGRMVPLLMMIFLLLLTVQIVFVAAHIHGLHSNGKNAPVPSLNMDWSKIRHLWLGSEYV